MTKTNSTNPKIDRKLSRLKALTDFVLKVDEACLGEEPQMRKEMMKLKKLALDEMRILNAELAKLAKEQIESDSDMV